MNGEGFIPLAFRQKSASEMLKAAAAFHQSMETRRTVRHFSDAPVDKNIIREAIMAASSAPSGAHKQPWTFCVVSNLDLKRQIRIAAEEEEYENYHGRMSEEWLEDLKPFDTDWKKPFLETVPYLIIIFKKPYDLVNGQKQKNYYVTESVGLAAGFLLVALHQAGLATLTHTPSPMNFLQTILERPKNEKPFLLIPVGYPTSDCQVPKLERKSEDQVIKWYE